MNTNIVTLGRTAVGIMANGLEDFVQGARADLLIRCRNDLLCQHICGFGKRQTVGHRPEITTMLLFLHGNCFEEERLAFHIHFHDGELPSGGQELGLFDIEMTALLQMPQ